jgi:hypothetical protein
MIRLEKLLRNKLAICGLAIASSAGAAQAAQITIFERTLENWDQGISAAFAVNRELGRAWIDVQVDPINIGEEPPVPVVIPQRIEGLYYDPARKQVVYRTATGTVVCAEDAKFLWSTYLKTTGQCSLTSVSEQRKVDDGFNVGERKVGKVVLEVGQ